MYLFDGYHCSKCHGLTTYGYQEVVGQGSADEVRDWAIELSAIGVDLTTCCCDEHLRLQEVYPRKYFQGCYSHSGIKCWSFKDLLSRSYDYDSYPYYRVLDAHGRCRGLRPALASDEEALPF